MVFDFYFDGVTVKTGNSIDSEALDYIPDFDIETKDNCDLLVLYIHQVKSVSLDSFELVYADELLAVFGR